MAPVLPEREAETLQARFERRWGQLTRPHVRALAWLLDAPDLLDAAAPRWQGRIATLPPDPAAADWLMALERDPAPLEAALGARYYSRLGLYAEKLLAFYFGQRGVLAAHGLQVRANKNDTVGEFDFLLRDGERLLHWEFATKFYLQVDHPGWAADLDGLVGPNLADTLGLKMDKILERQLALGRHPAAQPLLPQPVDTAQALVKGWLFYPMGEARDIDGIAAAHNRGFWSPLGRVADLAGERYAILPRLLWLAPLKTDCGGVEVFDRAGLARELSRRFAAQPAPVLVAVVDECDGWIVERERGFIVPDDWRERAALRSCLSA